MFSDKNTENLKLTPLGYANVPPPMALHEIQAPNTIVDAVVSINATHIAILQDEAISVYQYRNENKEILTPSLIEFGKISPEYNIVPRQICFVGLTVLVILGIRKSDGNNIMLRTDFKLKEYCLMEDSAPLSMVCSVHGTSFLLRCGINSRAELMAISEMAQRKPLKNIVIERLPKHIQGLEASQMESHIETDSYENKNMVVYNSVIVVALAKNGNLYCARLEKDNDMSLLTRGCTSFIVSCEYIIITTTMHYLKFIPISSGKFSAFFTCLYVDLYSRYDNSA